MMNTLFGSTRVWRVIGFVLLGVWSSGSMAAPAQNTTTYSAMQAKVETQLASRNAQCFTRCIKTYRTKNGLKLVVLDQNGKVYTIKHIPLVAGTKLLAIGHGSTSSPSYASSYGAPGTAQTQTITVSSNSQSSTYIVIQGGKRYAITITTTFVYENGVLIDVYTTTSKVLLTSSPELPSL